MRHFIFTSQQVILIDLYNKSWRTSNKRVIDPQQRGQRPHAGNVEKAPKKGLVNNFSKGVADCAKPSIEWIVYMSCYRI